MRTRDADPALLPALVQNDQVDHAIGALIRVGVDEQTVDDAEHGGGSADGERQRQDGREGKAEPFAQLAERESKVVEHIVDTGKIAQGYLNDSDVEDGFQLGRPQAEAVIGVSRIGFERRRKVRVRNRQTVGLLIPSKHP